VQDYEGFLSRLGRCSQRFSLAIYAYALMSNHYHLLVRTTNDRTTCCRLCATDWCWETRRLWRNCAAALRDSRIGKSRSCEPFRHMDRSRSVWLNMPVDSGLDQRNWPSCCVRYDTKSDHLATRWCICCGERVDSD